MRLVVGVVALLGAIASCTLFEDEIPDRSCTRDDQCFRAQGEVCDQETKMCVVRPDAGGLVDSATVVP